MLGSGRSAPTNSVPQSGQPPYPIDSGYFIAMDGGVPRGLAMALDEPFVTAIPVFHPKRTGRLRPIAAIPSWRARALEMAD
mgnify:CR=1 FL=1